MTWHYEPTTGCFTRHPAPDIPTPFNVRDVYGLTSTNRRHAIATHEAAHATVAIHHHIRFDHMAIDTIPTGDHETAGYVYRPDIDGRPLDDVLLHLAAGERAEDRWLREQGLWTPERAWAVELLALTDRRLIASQIPADDLTALHDEVDTLLDGIWPQVLRLAGALDLHGRLDYEQAVEHAAIPCGR